MDLDLLIRSCKLENERNMFMAEQCLDLSYIFVMESSNITRELLEKMKQDMLQQNEKFYKKLLDQFYHFYDSKEFKDKQMNILTVLKQNPKFREKKIKFVNIEKYFPIEEVIRKKFLKKKVDFKELNEEIASEHNDFVESNLTVEYTPTQALQRIKKFKNNAIKKIPLRQKTIESIIYDITIESTNLLESIHYLTKQIKSLNRYDKNYYVEFILDYAKIDLENIEKAIDKKTLVDKDSRGGKA